MFAALRPAARTAGVRAFSSTPATARDMARMTLIGRLGGVPEKRTTKNGKDFLIYKVATTDPFIAPKEGEEPVEPTTSWHSVFAYGQSAERLANLEKGSLVHVEANFTVSNVKLDSGEYKTVIMAKHDRLFVISKPKQKDE
ncbi:putative single-stranded DNA binding protein [Leucosporidium creatinivorum]|uniref:Single-stranded DNA-binding protein n=1 Tax=Leucosporidium creatinivorum TaxID=106004 RepID=A0A1Y2DMD4_9BASI|nr:putative single-stranded DNA binding protein [Leucosporidium creatinivorum]